MKTLLALLLIAIFPALSPGADRFAARYQEIISNPDKLSESQRLSRLFEIHWEYTMVENPEYATEVGYPGQNNRWSDLSLDALARRKEELKTPLAALAAIDRSKLSAQERLNYDLFKRQLDDQVEGNRFKTEYLRVTQMAGLQHEIPETLRNAPAFTMRDYEDQVARLKGVPLLVEQTLVLLKEGVRAGVTPPRVTLRDVADQVQSQIVADPARSVLLQAFTNFPASIPDGERNRLRREASSAFSDEVVPAYKKLRDYLANDYVPHARESISIADLPNGKDWYAFNVRHQTTTALSPSEIHDIGLREVKRIRAEMDIVIRQTGFKGTFAEFSRFLRTDPRFYYTNASDLLTGYRDITKRVDPELIKLFGTLPRLPYGVLPIPAYAEKSQTTAYYSPGSLTAGRPGIYFANTYDLKMRPKWEMEPLSLHESVPGHHLQISIAQEMENLPEFRKNAGYTAFVEGWGLYAESLGTEMGFYTDPYSKYGQLTYEMWRAIRLVVDTGMHSMGWSRQQAIDYFKENSSKAEHDIVVEIDRYIVWPGQALAYKIGELKIKELRAYARRELGDRFDVRKFHDEVLRNGALPLELLERQIKDWVAARQAAAR